jgi:hypothetical protein
MPDFWTLSHRDIEWYAGSDAILERGRSYYRGGRVRELQLVAEDRLQARVRGQQERAYRVEIWIEDQELYSHCSCPYSWGVCKHVVAALFAWLDRREEIGPGRPMGDRAASLAMWLETVPADILRDVLCDESRTNSAVEEALHRWREALRPEHLPARIAHLFRGMLRASQEGLRRNQERIAHLLVWAKTFEPTPAAAIARETLQRALEVRRHRPDAELTPIIAHALELIEHHAEAFGRDPKLATSFVRALTELFLMARVPARALLEPALLKLTERWGRRAEAITVLQEQWLGSDTGAYALLAQLCRLEGRIEEYEAARHKSLVSEEDYMELFDHYLATNYPDRAMRVGEQGIKALGAKAPRLRERLAALYQEWGETARAKRLLKRT